MHTPPTLVFSKDFKATAVGRMVTLPHRCPFPKRDTHLLDYIIQYGATSKGGGGFYCEGYIIEGLTKRQIQAHNEQVDLIFLETFDRDCMLGESHIFYYGGDVPGIHTWAGTSVAGCSKVLISKGQSRPGLTPDSYATEDIFAMVFIRANKHYKGILPNKREEGKPIGIAFTRYEPKPLPVKHSFHLFNFNSCYFLHSLFRHEDALGS
jgi:hypothetical protein